MKENGELLAHDWSLCGPKRPVESAVKRVVDVVLAGLGLVVLGPLLGLLALMIRRESPGPAIFQQARLGRRGQVFTIYKLRSMVEGAPLVLNEDGSTRVVAADPRVTPLGVKLRLFALDELPQLLNVLRGEMSLVGPRPDLDFQLQHYRGKDWCRLAMRPGMTSLAQVSGRNTLSWRERMALEVEYVERFSLLLDLQIAWRTAGVVVGGVGVNQAGPRVAEGGSVDALALTGAADDGAL